jgi:hypothetical protein
MFCMGFCVENVVEVLFCLILYIKATCLSVNLSGQFPGTAQTFVFLFFCFDGFCFLCQLNCPDLCLFVCFFFFFFFFLFWWVLFSVSVKLPGPLFVCLFVFFFFFFWWVLFSVSVKLPGPFFVCLFVFFFFLMGFVFCDSYYSTGALCTRFTLVCLHFLSSSLCKYWKTCS